MVKKSLRNVDRGWDEIIDPNGVMFYRKRGITNGTVDLVRVGDGWQGTFTPADDNEPSITAEKIYPDTYKGIIEAKIAIARLHSDKYTRAWYESYSNVYAKSRKVKKNPNHIYEDMDEEAHQDLQARVLRDLQEGAK